MHLKTLMFLHLKYFQVVEHVGFKTSERDHLFQVKQTSHQVSQQSYNKSYSFSYIMWSSDDNVLSCVPQPDVLM